MTHEQLIDKMVASVKAKEHWLVSGCLNELGWSGVAKDMLAVVKQHPEVVAMVCPCCRGKKVIGVMGHGDNMDYDFEECDECKGTGIVRRGEE
jgi:hypothetical protein